MYPLHRTTRPETSGDTAMPGNVIGGKSGSHAAIMASKHHNPGVIGQKSNHEANNHMNARRAMPPMGIGSSRSTPPTATDEGGKRPRN